MKKQFVMKPGHKKWKEFCARLDGPEGCNFKKVKKTEKTPLGMSWTCNAQLDRPFATKILKDMGADVDASLEHFSNHGGYCDCEILLNVDQ